MKIGVACVLIDKKRCIWLSQRLGEYQRGKYACPGGMVETTDLSDVHAIQREILEETGINADLSRFHKSIESKHYGGKSDVTHWFVLHLKDEVPKNTEPDKHGDWKLYTIEDAKKLPLMLSTNEVLNTFMKLNTLSLSNFTNHLSTMSAFEYLVEVLPKCSSEGPWIAGGALHRTYRNLPLHTSDVDVFFKDKQQMDAYVKELIMGENSHGKYKTKDYIVTEWHQSVTLQYMDNEWKIQCVTFKYFPTVEDLFKSFDINICRLAYDGEQVIGEENVLNDIKSNTIKFNKESINFPSVTLKRMVKYIKMGYDVNDEELKILSHSFYKGKKKNIIVDMDLSTKKHIDGEEYKNISTPTPTSLTIPPLTINVP